MPGGWKAALSFLAILLVLAGACGDDSGDVGLSWRTEDGRPLQVSPDNADAHETVIYVDNDSGETIRDAVLRFSPTTVNGAPIGFSVGTATNVPTDFDGDAHLWRLGDIKPNTRVVFNLGLWFEVASQVSSSPPIDLVMSLEGDNLPEALSSNALTVRFQ